MKGMYVNAMTQREDRERKRDLFNIPFTFAFVHMKGMYVNAMTQRENRERESRERENKGKREREKDPFNIPFTFVFVQMKGLFQILYFFLDVKRVWNGNQLACETPCGLIKV